LAQLVEGVTSARISDLKSEFKKRAEAQGAKFPETDCTPDDNNNTHYCSNGTLKEYGSVTDDGGKTYKTVVIGTQTWMAENLNYKVTGSKCGEATIITVTGWNDYWGTEWTHSYYPLKDNNTTSCDKYGRLYNWATAMALGNSCNDASCLTQISAKHRGICPVGYRIPTNADWDNLVTYAGGETKAGRYLKAAVGWNNCGSSNSYSYKCEDKYGFAALPGDKGYYDEFQYTGNEGNWWSSSENEVDFAYSRFMNRNNENAYWAYARKDNFFSVRCIKN